MKETLEAEKARLIEKIKQYDDQHKEAVKLANVFRKQLTQINRSIAVYDVPKDAPTDAEAIQDVSEGLK